MSIKRIALTVMLILGTAAPALPAAGQTLADRIATVRKKQAEQNAKRQTGSRQAKLLQALLYTNVTVRFEQTPTRDALDYLETVLGVNMIVRYHDDPSGIGIDPRTPITLEIEEVPALEVLELILEQCSVVEESTWQLRKSFIEVGPKERLAVAAAQKIRIFPVDEMLFQAPRYGNAVSVGFSFGYPGWVSAYESDVSTRGAYRNVGGGWGGWGGSGQFGATYGGGFGPAPAGSCTRGQGDDASINSPEAKEERAEELIEFIVTMIEPDAWQRNGGFWAAIDYTDGSLVIRAPDFIMRQIAGYPAVPPPGRGGPAAAGEKEPAEAGAPESRPGQNP